MAEKLSVKPKAERAGEKQPDPRVFVEVGLHQGTTVPFVGSEQFKKNKDENSLYIGIDLRRDRVGDAKEDAESMRINTHRKGNMLFVNGDARNLPLKNESADEIFFGNVFGDPLVSAQDKEAMLAEARRGIKSGGRLIIRETYTPMDLNRLEQLCREAGFRAGRVITGKNEAEIAEFKRFNRFDHNDVFSDGYALYAEPDEDWRPEEAGAGPRK